MAITLGSNIASLQAQRQLFKTDEKLSSVFERLSSGQRINRASDDAAGLAISETLNTDRRVFNQAIRNLNDGLSVLNIADSTVSELSGIATRIQELAEQSANGSLSNTQRNSLDAEAQQLKDEFFRISRSADFNGLNLFDGSIEDGLRLQGGYGEDGSIFSSLGGELADGTFQGVQTFAVTTNGDDLQTADLNGDGHLDVVASDNSEIGVFLGNGDGTFRQSQTISTRTTRSLELADINSDGTLDFISTGSSEIRYRLGLGNGTFGAASTITVGTGGNDAVRLGDFNNDGNIDVALADGLTLTNDIQIALGDGAGGFTLTTPISISTSQARGINELAIGDVNNDGNLDIAVVGDADDGDGGAAIVLGNGDGTFESPSYFLDIDELVDVAFADFDSDGNLDVLITDEDNNDLRIMSGDGTGSFTEEHVLSIHDATNSEIADLNGDGHSDIVTSSINGDTLTLFLNRGDGSFTQASTLFGGDRPERIRAGDVNSDGVLDLLVASNSDTIGVALGNTREGINPILDFSLETQADALQAMAPLERKLQSLSEQRGTIGAFQSRLQSALNTLSSTSENYAAAESRIRDADVAFESSQLTRLNILQQAATAVLGQANLQPSLALNLLQ